MTLFLHEEHELLHLVVNSIRKDLTDHNELFNCLALHAIANVGGKEMGEALSGEVHRLLISPYDPDTFSPSIVVNVAQHLKILCKEEGRSYSPPIISQTSRYCSAAMGRTNNLLNG